MSVFIITIIAAAVLLIIAILASIGILAQIVGWMFKILGKGCTYLSGCGCVALLIAIVFAAIMCCCSGGPDNRLREGDILLQVAAPSEFVSAIVASSATADSLQFAHCAMLVSAGTDSLVVLEATTPGGVKYTALDEFLAQSDSIGGKPAVIAMRVIGDRNLDVEATVANAKSHLGEPYDWSFLAANGKTYCSELLQTSYVDSDGKPIFSTIPLNFQDADGNTVQYWIDLYNRLGEEIPQGKPGTSPSSIAHSDCLQQIYSFF